jgi:RimJ/RimL family protein N-acetyltransferase
MMHGSRITLRAREKSDVPVLHTMLYNDVATRSRSDNRPWRPVPTDSATGPMTVEGASTDAACFTAVRRDDATIVGDAIVWHIDTHNRTAHLGISLLPEARGHGYSLDVISLLCVYGFQVRGLRRLQIDTLADNVAMRRTAERLGFRHEATLRSAAFVMGEVIDEVAYGLLAEEWSGFSDPGGPAAP